MSEPSDIPWPRPDPGAAGVCLTCSDALDPRVLTCRCTGHPLPPRPEPVATADLIAAWHKAAETMDGWWNRGNALAKALEAAEVEKAHLTKVATEYQSRIAELEAGLKMAARWLLAAATDVKAAGMRGGDALHLVGREVRDLLAGRDGFHPAE